MTYEWREHTAEVELALEGDAPETIFAAAAEAFGRLVEHDRAGKPARHRIELEARDWGSLLVDWLEELIFLADSESFVPDAVPALAVEPYRLAAEVHGRHAALDPLVKAATYHGLEFGHDGGTWHARVVLDV